MFTTRRERNCIELLQAPHVHEPDFISRGRYEVLMNERESGKMKDPTTNIILLAFKRTLSEFEKVSAYF